MKLGQDWPGRVFCRCEVHFAGAGGAGGKGRFKGQTTRFSGTSAGDTRRIPVVAQILEQRPESLQRQGRSMKRTNRPYGLSDVNLIASVISDGRCGQDAVTRATRLLDGYGSARLILSLPETSGGPFGACLTEVERRRLADARELATRLLCDEIAAREVVSTPGEVARFAARIAWCREEVLLLIGLDSHNHVAGSWEISRGWEGGINVHPRQVFSVMVRESIGRGVLVHNHPSGSLVPSDEDVRFTGTMISGGRQLGIDILDHVIVASGRFFSMRQGCHDLDFGPCTS